MHIYSFYFTNWDGWRCWWTYFVPEAIHYPLAIKLLASGLGICILHVCFTSITDFVFLTYMFRGNAFSRYLCTKACYIPKYSGDVYISQAYFQFLG